MHHERGDHMDPDEFRRLAHEAIDWIADYWSTVADRPVSRPVVPGEAYDAAPLDCNDGDDQV